MLARYKPPSFSRTSLPPGLTAPPALALVAGLPLDLLLGPGPSGSVSQQGAPALRGVDSPRTARRPPTRRATLMDLADAAANPTALAHPVPSMSGQVVQPGAGTPTWASPGALSRGSNQPGSPPPGFANGRDQPAGPSGQHGPAGGAGAAGDGASSDGAGIRRKLLQMMSLQRTKQRSSAHPATRSLGQVGWSQSCWTVRAGNDVCVGIRAS